MENFLNWAALALMDARTPVIAGLDVLHISALALMLIFLRLRIVNRKSDSAFESFRAASASVNHGASGRLLEKRRVPALKDCPNCAEQLPLSALMCDACDYNFLAAMPGRHKLLPAPREMP